jgi:hypothetical protein
VLQHQADVWEPALEAVLEPAMRGFCFAATSVFVACAGPALQGQVPGWKATGSGDNLSFARSLANVGDLNGDGADDVLTAHRFWSAGVATYEGRAYLLDGRTGAVLRTHVGPHAGDRLGWSFARLSDEDGDGVPEYAIGAPYDDTLATDGGAVLVYSGATGAHLRSIHGAGSLDVVGTVIAGIADVSGDGLDDLLVGSAHRGKAEIYDASGQLIGTLTGAASDRFGEETARVGDIDGDGIDDIAIGAPFGSSGFTHYHAGFVHFYSAATLTLIGSIRGPGAGFELGREIARLGDIDGDGYDDLLFGMPLANSGNGAASGQILLANGSNLANFRSIDGAAKGDQFGAAVAGLADLDADGIPDYAVAATAGGASNHYRVEARSGADDHVLWSVEGSTTATTNDSGLNVTLEPGDWNGDGTLDLAGGFPSYQELDASTGTWHTIGLAIPWLSAVPIAESYGLGWPGTFGTPTLTALTTPMLGHTLDVHATHTALGTTTALLLVGTAPATIPWRDGVLLVQPDLLGLYFTHAYGGTTFCEDLPDDPALAMLELYTQVIAADAGASRGVSFTAGLHLRLGWNYP